MLSIKPKKSLTEETYEILVDAICMQEFRPGQRLNQDEIAAKLNVSRQPVNSAIAILKADRLVEDTGRRGVVVSALDPDLFYAIYEYRLTIEPLAVGLATERRPVKAQETAEAVLRQGREAVSSGDLRAMLAADCRFHEMIYGWSRNQVIRASMHTNWQHIRRGMVAVLSEPEKRHAVWDEHETIVAAILRGDPSAGGEAMRAHIQSAYERNFASADQ